MSRLGGGLGGIGVIMGGLRTFRGGKGREGDGDWERRGWGNCEHAAM